MGRKITTFRVNDQTCQKSLSVTYHYRGKDEGRAEFVFSDDERRAVSFLLNSKEEAVELAHYLLNEVNYDGEGQAHSIPDFSITGYGLKIYCNGQEIRTLYDQQVFAKGVDSFYYNLLRKAFPEYNSDDYFFVVFGLKDNGMNRDTLERVITACIKHQEGVLVSGDLRLFKPMTQLSIAEELGLDNTTVSRAVKDVRIYTAHRNYSLDRSNPRVSLDYPTLFNEGLNGLSTIGIKLKMLALIESEDKENPLTDEELVTELSRFGYNIKRRTVVKYRDEHLGIPNSHQRRIRK